MQTPINMGFITLIPCSCKDRSSQGSKYLAPNWLCIAFTWYIAINLFFLSFFFFVATKFSVFLVHWLMLERQYVKWRYAKIYQLKDLSFSLLTGMRSKFWICVWYVFVWQILHIKKKIKKMTHIWFMDLLSKLDTYNSEYPANMWGDGSEKGVG